MKGSKVQGLEVVENNILINIQPHKTSNWVGSS